MVKHMCESNLYSEGGDLLMEDVIFIEVLEDGIRATDILDSQKEFHGKITRIDLDKHRIYIETED
ncbi:CooT family nickel-binding protein [Methanothermobacter thermautotrophicus]|nr:CooT family nickel-binding protein [Methanothermobacter thermautotrophicus]